jgi:cysteine desulfurase family protein
MIYFDHAATSLQKPPEVAEAVCRAFREMGNAGRGAHDATLKASRLIYDTREKLADLFGLSDVSQVAFTCNATEALNTALFGVLNPGDHVITTVCEHNSVLRPLYLLEQQGVELSFLPADARGVISYDDLESLYRSNTRAVVVTHASNVTGNVTDLERISSFTRKHQLLLIVDASQTAGMLPLKMEAAGIDILCFTGHKGLMGPQGTGGICVREGVDVRPLKVGGSGIQSFSRTHPGAMPTALEAGTLNGHGIAGLNASLDFLKHTGIENIHRREQMLCQRFLDGIRRIRGITVYGDLAMPVRASIVSLNIRDMDSSMVSDLLWEDYEICTRAGAHCAPLMHETLGTAKQGTVRFSFSWFNTEQEIDAAVTALREIAGDENGYREMV